MQDIVIQAILRHSDVSATRESHSKRDGVDARSIAAMKALESLLYNYGATNSAAKRAAVVVN
ncbi:MAG: hypothetical protein WCC59_08515 [Terriglobales bacterium]